MSFKREGDDTGLLGNLRRRRIKDLLAEDIPEDEAKLLCNGRLACLVCSHRPVFDTVGMLTVHRKGKKHTANETVFLQKKKELRHLILKRQHEQFMKDGTTVIKQAVLSAEGGIGTSRPYDPRVKKHKLKPYERKPRLALSESCQLETSGTVTESQTMRSAACLPLRHGHQLKNIFRPGRSQMDSTAVQPYRSRRHGQCDIGVAPPSDVAVNSTSHQNLHNSHTRTGEVCQTERTDGMHSNFRGSDSACGAVASLPVGQAELNWTASSVSGGYSSGVCDRAVVNGCALNTEPLNGRNNRSDGTVTDKGAVQYGSGRSADQVSVEQRQRAQQYLHLRGSGWKKDWDGKWIRDEDAEFDSDEEPPDLP